VEKTYRKAPPLTLDVCSTELLAASTVRLWLGIGRETVWSCSQIAYLLSSPLPAGDREPRRPRVLFRLAKGPEGAMSTNTLPTAWLRRRLRTERLSVAWCGDELVGARLDADPVVVGVTFTAPLPEARVWTIETKRRLYLRFNPAARAQRVLTPCAYTRAVRRPRGRTCRRPARRARARAPGPLSSDDDPDGHPGTPAAPCGASFERSRSPERRHRRSQAAGAAQAAARHHEAQQ